jgi:hypothetical protein
MSSVIRIANCSGYYGDRLSAARELVEGGPIDVLTGDYLAELTMSILYDQRKERGPDAGYVGTFLKQLEDVAAACLAKGIRIVVNAGGLNPAALAAEVEALLARLNLTARIAWIDGDDLMPDLARLQAAGEAFSNLDTGAALADAGQSPVTANVYLGAWGIKEALDRGADIVLCPRVTDAALVIGPAAWKFGWKRDDYDALAGALAAGHIIECGAQACGGNYSFFEEVASFRNVGYPIAEIEADGSFTITKHPGTGGLVSVGTVTAQLLYEIGSPAYLNPDVTAHFDTLRMEEAGPDRVRVTGCRGSSPPPTHKVCLNTLGAYKQTLEVLLTGLDIERKAEVYIDQLFWNLGGRERFDQIDVQLIRTDHEDPSSNETAHALLRVTLASRNPRALGRLVTAKTVELGLATIPGNAGRGGAGFSGAQTIVHWPALIDSRHVCERVHIGGAMIEVAPTQRLDLEAAHAQRGAAEVPACPAGPLQRIAFGRLFGARSGDKGGSANCGVWARSKAAYGFLYAELTVERFKALLPDMAGYHIERFELPNLWALNFVIHGVLGEGASANTRIDRQAKSLGEYLRAKWIEAPVCLLEEAQLRTS